MLSKIYIRLLMWIFRRAVIQGDHRKNTITILRLLRYALEDQFPEDNRPTINEFLRECLEEAKAPTLKFKTFEKDSNPQ